MAALDKIYLSSVDEYRLLRDWVKDKSFITPRGVKVNVRDSFIEWDESMFTDHNGNPCERPVMSTDSLVDNYLWHKCPFQFVKDYLEDRYCGKGYCKGCPDDIKTDMCQVSYDVSRKVKIIKKGFSHNLKCCLVDVKDKDGRFLRYYEDGDWWILHDEKDEWTGYDCFLWDTSIRAVIRRVLKKWNLPAGCTITACQYWSGNEWILKTK